MINCENVLNDPEIIALYNSVNSAKNNNWASHGLSHIYQCIENVQKIFDIFDIQDNSLKENCLIACSLHDTGMLNGKANHAKRSYIFAKQYLKNKLDKKDYKIVLATIYNHSFIRNKAPLIERILVLADKLDMSHSRLLEGGKSINGMRQVEFIQNIDIFKENNVFIVLFTIDKQINLQEWKKYYFTKKMELATENLAKYFHIKWEFRYIFNKNAKYSKK